MLACRCQFRFQYSKRCCGWTWQVNSILWWCRFRSWVAWVWTLAQFASLRGWSFRTLSFIDIDDGLVIGIKCVSRLLISVPLRSSPAFCTIEARLSILTSRAYIDGVSHITIIRRSPQAKCLLIAIAIGLMALPRAALPLLFWWSHIFKGALPLDIGCAIRHVWRRLSYNKIFRVITARPESIVHSKVVKLGQIIMHSHNFLMLNCSLHFGLGRIALLLLFNEFLNFSGVQSWRSAWIILDIPCLDHAFNFRLDISIGQILLLK